ncbi:MAG: hypothetical protein JWN20_2681, partial [Jatrophihabitantaceae bacterium]|nr:hypothetical protein [Jatrophihabitantaceae bacterium]
VYMAFAAQRTGGPVLAALERGNAVRDVRLGRTCRLEYARHVWLSGCTTACAVPVLRAGQIVGVIGRPRNRRRGNLG